jgi:lysophospholipase L1-like esterase
MSDVTPRDTWTADTLREKGMTIPEVRFGDEIERFAREDCLAPPAEGTILFVGDSDIRLWSEDGIFERAFAGLPVVNRGFGGARAYEALLYARTLIGPHKPTAIVYCCGENDIRRLGPAGRDNAVTGFALFLDFVRESHPGCRVYYMAIHSSSAGERFFPLQAEANGRIRAECDRTDGAVFLDFLPMVQSSDGAPAPGAFRPDGLHFSRETYVNLGRFVRAALEKDGVAAGRR